MVKLGKAELALTAVSAVIGYVLLEAGFRFYLYQTTPAELVVAIAGQMPEARAEADFDSSWYIFDLHSGWRYPPNHEQTMGHPWFSHWRSNSHGHISDDEYPVARPDGEYRICVLGDSFTANHLNTVRWPAILEDGLNASSSWREAIDANFTRILNFAIDGQGVEQMAMVAEFHARPFGCNLMLVNFISDDFLRRLHYAGWSAYADQQDEIRSIEDYVRDKYLADIDWFTFRPEVLAAAMGSWIGLEPTLPSKFTVPNLIIAERYYERSQAVTVGGESLATISWLYENSVFLLIPMHEDLAGIEIERWIGLMEDIVAAAPALRIVDMSHYLALPETRAELRKWFFLPHDTHYSDYGVERYADAMLRYMTGDFLASGSDLGESAIISAETVRNGAADRRHVVEVLVATPAPAPTLVRLTTASDADLGQLLDEWSQPYEAYGGVANAVSASGAPAAADAAAILGKSVVLEERTSFVKVVTSVTAYAADDTEIVVGLFFNNEAEASFFGRMAIAGGDTGVVEFDYIVSVEGPDALGIRIRIGVVGGAVFLNGDDVSTRDDVGKPILTVEQYSGK